VKPCDCKDMVDAANLPEQGLAINDTAISVRPCTVVIEHGPCTLVMSQIKFKALAEWYLADQEDED